uniref:2-hydroxyacyl-CoA lyase 2 n=2 Tax=Parascaris univalens TaxID=6257 RepID=A0A915BLG6_PARUN
DKGQLSDRRFIRREKFLFLQQFLRFIERCAMLLIIALFLLIFILLLWKWLDITCVDSLKKILKDILTSSDKHFLSNLFQVDESSKRHGGELVAAVLKAHGVKEIFTLCGGHISPILVAAENIGIRIIDTRHEVNAVFAADAVARLRQSIGVAAVTAGPGVTNTITALKNAQIAESPVVLIGGAAPTLLKNRGALQDIDQIVLFRSLCKYVARVTRLRDIVPTMRAAICAAQSGTPGPVFVEFPVDVLYPYQLVAKEAGFLQKPKNWRQSLINLYLRAHISRQFGDAWRECDMGPLPPNIPLPNDRDINKLAEIVSNARRPLMLIGSQATLPPLKPNELRQIVEKLSIPVYLGGMARGLLGKESAIQMRQNRKVALKEADVIILAGVVCDFRLSYGRVLSSTARIVSINRNPSQGRKNEGIFWKANLVVQADIASTLKRLAEHLAKSDYKGVPSEWHSTLSEREHAKNVANERKAMERLVDGNLNPLRVLSLLDKVLPDDAILIADGGDFVGSAAYIVRPRGPLQWLDPGAFGTLGVGGGFAIGAKVVHPERSVFILYGDGSCGFSLMEVDTFTRHKLHVAAIIGNDACWSQIAREQVPMFGSDTAVGLSHVRYDDVGIALGAKGVLITKDDENMLEEKLSNVVNEVRSGQSVVVNVIIGKTNFREGSISV